MHSYIKLDIAIFSLFEVYIRVDCSPNKPRHAMWQPLYQMFENLTPHKTVQNPLRVYTIFLDVKTGKD